MDRFRIALVDMPRMLNEIFEQTVSNDVQLELVGNFREQSELEAAIRQCSADFVIAGCDSVPEDDLGRLLGGRPEVKLLAVLRDGRDSTLYELKRVPLGERSPEQLVGEIIAIANAAR